MWKPGENASDELHSCLLIDVAFTKTNFKMLKFEILRMFVGHGFICCLWLNLIANVINENEGCHGFVALREVHFEAFDNSSYVFICEFVCLQIN